MRRDHLLWDADLLCIQGIVIVNVIQKCLLHGIMVMDQLNHLMGGKHVVD